MTFEIYLTKLLAVSLLKGQRVKRKTEHESNKMACNKSETYVGIAVLYDPHK